MSAYSAFVVLREYLARNSTSDLSFAIETIRRTNSDVAGLDYEAGTAIYENLKIALPDNDPKAALRLTVCALIKLTKPWWLRFVPYGRDRVLSVLDPDQIQCLREAGLLDPVPDSETVAFWDELAATARGESEQEKMARAREAERLSLKHERDRLKSLHILREPEWVSLEDNTLGYDVRSYDRQGEHIVSRLIEVKSAMSDSIVLSRNEWLNAISADQHYWFHVWIFPEKRVLEYPVSAIRPSIPTDRGSGEWQSVRISLQGLPGAPSD